MKPSVVCLLALVPVLLWLLSLPVSAETLLTRCTRAGAYAERVVKDRDHGAPPSDALRILEVLTPQNRHEATMKTFAHWIVLFVYDKYTMDAAWLRQRVETTCLQAQP
jgi:hypothetical protein